MEAVRYEFQHTIMTKMGAGVFNCQVEVRSKATGDLVALYPSPDDGIPMLNPMTSDQFGHITAWVDAEEWDLEAIVSSPGRSTVTTTIHKPVSPYVHKEMVEKIVI